MQVRHKARRLMKLPAQLAKAAEAHKRAHTAAFQLLFKHEKAMEKKGVAGILHALPVILQCAVHCTAAWRQVGLALASAAAGKSVAVMQGGEWMLSGQTTVVSR
jgi:hypothetical protein